MTKDVYLEEYESKEAVPKYVAQTAGAGIAYALEHVYGPIYDDLLSQLAPQAAKDGGFRVLEYGCGGGMNLLWIARHLLKKGQRLNLACGTDFASAMVEASKKEAVEALNAKDRDQVSFHVVANENLAKELPAALGRPPEAVMSSFHFIVGVNTFRYCFRGGKESESARAIHSLLKPGGYPVMIEMNSRFPLFRSMHRNDDIPKEQRFLPTLEQYAAVFREAGLELVTVKNFCWIPHSASPAMVTLLRMASPVLQAILPRRATRSLVVARKPILK